jgi:hypothetical protein
MKPLLLCCALFIVQALAAQSLDYLSVRKKNGQVVKNFYAGSTIVLQLTDGSYVNGPVQTIRNDSVHVTVYDIRYAPTPWGGYVRDTISTNIVPVPYKEISRIYLQQRRGFFQRKTGPLLMLGGGGYLLLNVTNGAFHGQSITDADNLRRIGLAAGAFGIGFLFQKLLASDGFSKKKHQIIYIDL